MKKSKKHLIGLANEYAAGTPYRIPLGLAGNQDKDGRPVMQRLSRENAAAMINEFMADKTAKGENFPGIPVYIGHPDHPAFKDRDKDIRAYGWGNDISLDDQGAGGMTFTFDWPPAGSELLNNKHFKFLSPHFLAVMTNEKIEGVPVVDIIGIKSIGMTNNPNWPGVPTLVNEEQPAGDAAGDEGGGAMTLLERLAKALGMDPAAGEEAIATAAEQAIEDGRAMMEECNACLPPDSAERKALGEKPTPKALIQGMVNASGKKAVATANEQLGALQIKVTTAEGAAATAATQIQTANEKFTGAVDGVVDTAIRKGLIVLANRETWKGMLLSGFANAVKDLFDLTPAVKTESNKSVRSPAALGVGREQEQLALVNELLPQHNKQFDKAWAAARAKRPDLFL
jgi:hypothetical protein